MRNFLIISFLFIFKITVFAQVGINNDTPDQFSVLDVKSTKSGVLIPRMTTDLRTSITLDCEPKCPNGLLVFDTDKKAFFYYIKNKWYLINPFTVPDATQGTPEAMYTNDQVVSSIGIGKKPIFPYKLDINGNYQVSGTSSYDTLVNSNGVIVSDCVKVSSGDINVKGNIAVPSGKIYTNTFSSDISDKGVSGAVPKGGIVIWNGTEAQIPAGWAICDGQNGTPDLRERFVVGAGASYSVGDVGGEVTHKLTVNEIWPHVHPGKTDNTGAHQHKFYGYRVPEDYDCAGCHNDKQSKSKDNHSGDPLDYGGESAGSHSHTCTINSTGSDTPHENRPPYYALAFIMKL